jgi:hypothetical protein
VLLLCTVRYATSTAGVDFFAGVDFEGVVSQGVVSQPSISLDAVLEHSRSECAAQQEMGGCHAHAPGHRAFGASDGANLISGLESAQRAPWGGRKSRV